MRVASSCAHLKSQDLVLSQQETFGVKTGIWEWGRGDRGGCLCVTVVTIDSSRGVTVQALCAVRKR